MRKKTSGRTGDAAPERALLDGLLQAGYRYALSLTAEPAAAEDLVGDACLALSRRGGPWDEGYLIRCIRNRHVDGHRRSRVLRFEPLPASLRASGAEALPEPADPALERALAELRPEERELLFLAEVEGYSAREIGEITERPRGSVLSALHRAKGKLRKRLGDEAKEGTA